MSALERFIEAANWIATSVGWRIGADAGFGNAAERASGMPGTTAPATPPKGPSDDMAYLGHAFEPQVPYALGAWTVERIRSAREAHKRGEFELSAPLADDMFTDARVAAGLMQRLGPLLGIPRQVKGGARWGGAGLAEKVRVEAEAMFAPEATSCPPGVLASGFVATAMMGTAILQNVYRGRADGSRIDVETRPWPMQLSRWNEARKRYEVATTEGWFVVEPNDGKWIVIEPYGPRSYMFGAIRPLALVWADRAYALRDRSNHSAAHGSMSIIGTLPSGISVKDEIGQAFVKAIQMLQRARSGIVKSFGTNVEAFEPKTIAWQIFSQIVNSANSDIMLMLNGITDSRVYKPISQIDGVRYDLVRIELGAGTVGYNEGLLKPWALLNFGDPTVVPKMGWAIPDPREQERVDALGRRYAAYAEAIEALKKAGFKVDQGAANRLAELFGVEALKLDTAPAVAAAAGDDPGGAAVEQQEDEQIRRNDAATS